jgi:hypothetical protein
MKNLFKFSIVLIAASTLFSSCGSDFSIMKRHYTSGYYVDYTKSNKEVAPKGDKNIEPVTIAQINSVPAASQQNNAPVISSEAKTEKAPSKLPGIKNILPSINFPSITKQAHVNTLPVLENPSAESNKAVYESPSTSNNVSDRDEHAALSLLWLVIVIILILWLIGLIAGGFGLGGLINLLLVIALILLVLWLLRII